MSGGLLVYTPAMATQTTEPLDFGKALRFFFEDPRWVNKIVLGSVFTLLSMFFVGGFFVAGYVIRVLRRAARGEEHPLPEWDDLGGIFTDGARAIAVYLGHIVPLALLLGLLGLAAGGAAASSHDAPDALRIIAVLVMLAGYLVFTVAGIALLLYLPAAILRFVIHDRVAAAFEFRENLLFEAPRTVKSTRAIDRHILIEFKMRRRAVTEFSVCAAINRSRGCAQQEAEPHPYTVLIPSDSGSPSRCRRRPPMHHPES